ncbi:Lnb N-terminal periplasmic domain-containing protein [Paludibacter jiangxiensis]|uniref:Uncharacterized protein n=1 Tax=Paludibacter jiangxiensis TaxID=681398 RepID=A0A170YW09_9BACT|nr:DUF4105 domain-containing protein [Paludibacter jiangxiensis]GAT62118.1 hypothetical protein PJIAN_1708 [Paludibacter jiangxiensis]
MRRPIILLLFFVSIVTAGAVTLSDSAKVSLLTCGPGPELYAKFGHSAIRISDPANHLDISFNYGYFDYNTPGFYYKFVNGETDYQLGVTETSEFILEYQLRQINMWEQVLNLKQSEKQALFDALVENYKPEHRYYRYNFVFDNCATRPRDMIIGAIKGKITFDKNLEKKKETFQQLIDLYTEDSPAILFGIHLVLGAPKDNVATFQQTMFLPERLMRAAATARIQRDSTTVPLVSSSSQLVTAQGKDIKPAFNYIPWICVLLLLVTLWICSKDKRNRKLSIWFDAILFGIGGAAGFIVFYLTSFSVHPLVSSNWNVVWLNPLLLVFAFTVCFRQTRKFAFYLQFLFLACEVFMMITLFMLPQSFVIAEILLIIVLALRSIMYLRLKGEYFRSVVIANGKAKKK